MWKLQLEISAKEQDKPKTQRKDNTFNWRTKRAKPMLVRTFVFVVLSQQIDVICAFIKWVWIDQKQFTTTLAKKGKLLLITLQTTNED